MELMEESKSTYQRSNRIGIPPALPRQQPNFASGTNQSRGNPNTVINQTTTKGLLPTPTNSNYQNLPIRRFTLAYMQERRDKGLSYGCDQKWSRGHKCQSKFLMLIGDDEDGIEIENNQHGDGLDHCNMIIGGDISSLNAMAGKNNPRSLRIWGEIGESRCLILIDSGSTHNFITPTTAEKLNLQIQPTNPFQVSVGHGDTLLCKFLCPKVKIVMQGNEFLIDLYVLHIKGPDVVLGIQWLQNLGEVTHDYACMSMKFLMGKKKVQLQGDTMMNL